jgi:hypothetical protein
MDYDNDALMLRYELQKRSSETPYLQLMILKKGRAVLYRTPGTGPESFLQLSKTAEYSLRRILELGPFYSLGELESTKEFWGGYHNYSFYFSSGDMRAAYRGVDLEYLAGDARAPKVNCLFDLLRRVGEILVPLGVPEECFEPAERLLDEPVKIVTAPVDTFPVYDFQTSGGQRTVGAEKDNVRLERYAFEKYSNGEYKLAVQLGWPGGNGHWDGAGSSFSLPEEWFDKGFEDFLISLTDRYPAEKYGFGRAELTGIPGLKDFLGFGKNKKSEETEERRKSEEPKETKELKEPAEQKETKEPQKPEEQKKTNELKKAQNPEKSNESRQGQKYKEEPSEYRYYDYNRPPAILPDELSSQDLQYASEFREGVHREALEIIQQNHPEITEVVDRWPVEEYYQYNWEYPGKWYLYVAVPAGSGGRQSLIRTIVSDTLDKHRQQHGFKA